MTQLDLFDRSLVATNARARANLTHGLNERIGGQGCYFNRPSPSASRKLIIAKYRTTRAGNIIVDNGPFVRLGQRLDIAWRRALAWSLDLVYRRLMGLC